MSRRPRGLTAALAVAGSLALTSTAVAGQAPPLPTAANGATVERLAGGLATPTSFAFTGRHGLRRHRAGRARSSADGPHDRRQRLRQEGPGHGPGRVRSRLAQRPALRVVRRQDHSYRGWNGTRFTGSRVVRRANSKLPGFNGLAFGPDGRLYTGVGLNPKFDHSRTPRSTRTPCCRCAPPAPT